MDQTSYWVSNVWLCETTHLGQWSPVSLLWFGPPQTRPPGSVPRSGPACPPGEPGAARWCVGTGLGCDTWWSLRSPLLKLLACCRLLFLRMRTGYGQTLHAPNTHTLLCNVWDVIQKLLNHYLSLQQTSSRYYQSRSQCRQLYEVLWTFPGLPSSGWWCGTWEHPLLHLIPERVDTEYRVSLCKEDSHKWNSSQAESLWIKISGASHMTWGQKYIYHGHLFPQHSN